MTMVDQNRPGLLAPSPFKTIPQGTNPDSIVAASGDGEGTVAAPAPSAAVDWLMMAREAAAGSQTYFESSVQKHIIDDIRQAGSQFKSGSKYLHPDYQKRSRLFRPKTKSTIRKNEASAAEAFFGTRDMIQMMPENDHDDLNVACARYIKELVEYRLRVSIPWFLLAMGAYQEAQTVGVVCSKQEWCYDPKKKRDHPSVKLVPVENLRVDPACDWTDPINSSPYVIEYIPMYVKDVQAKGRDEQNPWSVPSDGMLMTSANRTLDSVRQAREGKRQDPKDQRTAITPFTVVWVHLNIIEVDGQDWVYHTLGVDHLLSTPKPIEQVWWSGKRPYVMGMMALEAHKNYPGGIARMTAMLQEEINELANSRIDNVKLVLNKRYLVKRNGRVDIRSISRNVAGSSTLVDNIETDVKMMDTPDITSSSFKEMDLLNADYDDIAGTFSQSSVVTNKNLNETVGGFQMLDQKANQVGQYQLRTFAITWMIPVLRQVAELEAHYEDDEDLMTRCLASSGIADIGITQVTNELLMKDLIVDVSVGQSATDPSARMAMLTNAFGTIRANLADGSLVAMGVKPKPFMDEVFSMAGYRDSERFFDPKVDPNVGILQKQVSDLQAKLDQKGGGDPDQIVAAKADLLAAQKREADSGALKNNTTASFQAIQAAGVIALTPAVAPIADEIMKAGGYQPANPAGVSPQYEGGMPGGPLPQPAAPVPGAEAGVNAPDLPGGMTPSSDPLSPGDGGVGEQRGIETPRNEGA